MQSSRVLNIQKKREKKETNRDRGKRKGRELKLILPHEDRRWIQRDESSCAVHAIDSQHAEVLSQSTIINPRRAFLAVSAHVGAGQRHLAGFLRESFR